jgi:hypothetical protein
VTSIAAGEAQTAAEQEEDPPRDLAGGGPVHDVLAAATSGRNDEEDEAGDHGDARVGEAFERSRVTDGQIVEQRAEHPGEHREREDDEGGPFATRHRLGRSPRFVGDDLRQVRGIDVGRK